MRAGRARRRHDAASACPGCRPARCGRTSRQIIINAAITAEASGRLSASPPSSPVCREIPDRCTERTGENKCRPEQQDVRHIGPKVERGEHRKSCGKNESATTEAKTAGIRHPIAERGTQCLRKCDGGPVERLRLRVFTASTEIVPCDRYQRPSTLSDTQTAMSSRPYSRSRASGRRNPPWSCRRWWRRRS